MIKESELNEYFDFQRKCAKSDWLVVAICYKCRHSILQGQIIHSIRHEHPHGPLRVKTIIDLNLCDLCWTSIAGRDWEMIWDDPKR